jgi:predicted nucleotidyltransferase
MATKTDYQTIVETLKERLLTEIGDRIHSIVLFGSVARGEATNDSDIDLLVIADGGSETKDRIQHVANDISLENEVLSELTTFSTESFRTEVRMRSWFASDVLMQGRVLTDDGTYGSFRRQFEEGGSMETGPTREFVDRMVDMAEESLQASISDLGQQLFRSAVDRAYYCMHHAAKAILADRRVRPTQVPPWASDRLRSRYREERPHVGRIRGDAVSCPSAPDGQHIRSVLQGYAGNC